jgi:hypothetical protein
MSLITIPTEPLFDGYVLDGAYCLIYPANPTTNPVLLNGNIYLGLYAGYNSEDEEPVYIVDTSTFQPFIAELTDESGGNWNFNSVYPPTGALTTSTYPSRGA